MDFIRQRRVLFSVINLMLILFELKNVNGRNEESAYLRKNAPVYGDVGDDDLGYGNLGYGDQAYSAKNTPAYSEQAYGDPGYGNPGYGDLGYGDQTSSAKNAPAYGDPGNGENVYKYKTSKSRNRTPVTRDPTTTVKPIKEDIVTHTTEKNCYPTPTTINGGKSVECAERLIFEESFDNGNLDMKKWKAERRFATEPDYEFNMYLDDVYEVLDTRNGCAIIKPKPTSRQFLNINKNLHADLSLGFHCTGRIDTEDCNFRAANVEILPPLITAQISTKDLFSFKYGRVEIRAKLPQTDWVFPQFWLQPVENIYGTKNYQSGQIRIAFSQMNGENMELSGGVLLNAGEPWRLERMCAKPDWNDLKNTDKFHTFSLTWTEHDLAFAVDGREYCKVYETNKRRLPNRALLENGTPLAPFDKEFYLVIGYGIGGHNDFEDSSEWQVPKPWVNFSPKAQTEFWKSIENRIDHWLKEATLEIDWIRIYSSK